MDDVEQIEDNARLYRLGRNSAYQGVAIQLRNLLLGGRRGLLLRVVPDASLHAFAPERGLSPVPAGAVLAMEFHPRGFLTLGMPGGAQLQLEFSSGLLPVEKWLNQWIIVPDVTLRRLIEQTTNDEVAHTAEQVDTVIQKAAVFRFGGRSSGRELHAMALVSLGEYVARRVHELLTLEAA